MDERRVLAEDIFRRVCSKDNGRFDIFVRPLPRKKKRIFIYMKLMKITNQESFHDLMPEE